jgi:hypothetical protein
MNRLNLPIRPPPMESGFSLSLHDRIMRPMKLDESTAPPRYSFNKNSAGRGGWSPELSAKEHCCRRGWTDPMQAASVTEASSSCLMLLEIITHRQNHRPVSGSVLTKPPFVLIDLQFGKLQPLVSVPLPGFHDVEGVNQLCVDRASVPVDTRPKNLSKARTRSGLPI